MLWPAVAQQWQRGAAASAGRAGPGSSCRLGASSAALTVWRGRIGKVRENRTQGTSTTQPASRPSRSKLYSPSETQMAMMSQPVALRLRMVGAKNMTSSSGWAVRMRAAGRSFGRTAERR